MAAAAVGVLKAGLADVIVRSVTDDWLKTIVLTPL